MPAIPGHALSSQQLAQLERREWRHTVGQSGMTPTAFAFLIPLFVIAVFCPFVCVFCLRRRPSAAGPGPARPLRKPALQREEARKRLNAVTKISTPTNEDRAVKQENVEQSNATTDGASIAERECAICLSTLCGPSPPEPARIASEAPASTETSTRPPSIRNVPTQNETILKLNACGHEFHAECLVSWFVLRKITCPICRTAYISKEEMLQLDEEAALAAMSPPAVAAAASTPSVDPAAAATPASVRNWRYFWRGQEALNTQNASATQPSQDQSTSRWQNVRRARDRVMQVWIAGHR